MALPRRIVPTLDGIPIAPGSLAAAARIVRLRREREAGVDSKYNWRRVARPKQLAPVGDWLIWLIQAGRRWGKGRSAAEWIREEVYEHGARHVAFVSSTTGSVRRIMVEGISGILAVCPPAQRPRYEPSLRRLTFPNGAIATTFSAESPEDLRGPEHDAAWADEVDAWAVDGPRSSPQRALDTFSNLRIGLSRSTSTGERPRMVVTSTPKRGRIVAMLRADAKKLGNVHVTTGHTLENADNLDPAALDDLLRRYEGTTIGRQELAGELFEELQGALWTQARLDELRVRPGFGGVVPDLQRVVVAVDPPGSHKPASSEAGIVAAGKGVDGHGYLLDDRSCRMSPAGWAVRAVELYQAREADLIVAEKNHGGDMVEYTIKSVTRTPLPIKLLWASRGKAVRAQPVASLTEQGLVHMVGDAPFEELEHQLCSMTEDGYEGGGAEGESPSPDRLDAYVWAMTELMLGAGLSRGIGVPGAARR